MRDFDDSFDLLVDELGGIRARIAALKAQEAAIRADILARVVPGNAPRDVAGQGFTLRIVQSETRRIDTKALPAHILGNPAYFKTTTSVRLTTKSLDSAKLLPALAPDTPAPVGPTANDRQKPNRLELPADDFDVIEAW